MNLGAMKDERLSPLWHTIAMTGMRRGEAIGLRWSDVDLEGGRRVIALDPGTVEVLKAQAARQ